MFVRKFLFILFIIFFLQFCSDRSNSYQQVHIDFTLEDNDFYNFVRIIYFPEKKITVFVFINPEAYFDPKITEENIDNISYDYFLTLKKQQKEEKISLLNSILNKNSNFYISFTKENFIRFINFTEGIKIFLPTAIELPESEYFFKNGFHKLFGENVYEFFSKEEHTLMNENEYAIFYKHYRWETIILNFFYQLQFKPKLYENKNQFSYLYSFMKTNTNKENIQWFLKSITESKFFLLELPLIAKKQINQNHFFLNIPKSKNLYENYIKNLFDQENKKTSVNLEILNANGTDRLANRVKMRIHSDQFKVLNVDNYSFLIPHTILLCNIPNGYELDKITNLLNLKKNFVYFYRTIKDIPYGIILGEDFSIKNLLKK